jgi:predicted fused transcriptional regulator/phosphomethylpyrimidine kinase
MYHPTVRCYIVQLVTTSLNYPPKRKCVTNIRCKRRVVNSAKVHEYVYSIINRKQLAVAQDTEPMQDQINGDVITTVKLKWGGPPRGGGGQVG